MLPGRLERRRSLVSSSSYLRVADEMTDSARPLLFLRPDDDRPDVDFESFVSFASFAPTSLRPENAAFHMFATVGEFSAWLWSAGGRCCARGATRFAACLDRYSYTAGLNGDVIITAFVCCRRCGCRDVVVPKVDCVVGRQSRSTLHESVPHANRRMRPRRRLHCAGVTGWMVHARCAGISCVITACKLQLLVKCVPTFCVSGGPNLGIPRPLLFTLITASGAEWLMGFVRGAGAAARSILPTRTTNRCPTPTCVIPSLVDETPELPATSIPASQIGQIQ
jgi:hypothetical protein